MESHAQHSYSTIELVDLWSSSFTYQREKASVYIENLLSSILGDEVPLRRDKNTYIKKDPFTKEFIDSYSGKYPYHLPLIFLMARKLLENKENEKYLYTNVFQIYGRDFDKNKFIAFINYTDFKSAREASPELPNKELILFSFYLTKAVLKSSFDAYRDHNYNIVYSGNKPYGLNYLEFAQLVYVTYSFLQEANREGLLNYPLNELRHFKKIYSSSSIEDEVFMPNEVMNARTLCEASNVINFRFCHDLSSIPDSNSKIFDGINLVPYTSLTDIELDEVILTKPTVNDIEIE